MNKVKESFLSRFLKLESAGGITLMLTAVFAMILANSPALGLYNSFLNMPVEVKIGALEIAKPLLLWINDALMAVFFFLVGLELKRELVEGELSDPRNIILPGIGAVGGMIAPALIYVFFNAGDPETLHGWAIPAATDIAFALGILSLLGSRVPVSLKIFLTSLAIFDDIGAILIIAFFYTSKLSITALIVAACCIPVLAYMNKRNVYSKSCYIMVGVVLWVAMLKSGVHATLAGVILAMFIPMESRDKSSSPLREMEHSLHSVVAFIILPIFAFANSGINLAGVGVEQLIHPVPMGIAFGLFIGKQIGVFSFCWIAIQCKIAQMPKGMNWCSLYSTAVLCGIGFTMSLFVGSLAFVEITNKAFDERIGIILGSLASGIIGYFLLKSCFASEDKAALKNSKQVV